MTTELKPCPHCGSEQITPVPDRNWGCVSWAAVCRECAARTGPYNTEAEAIAAWNQRTSPPAADNAARCPACKSTNISWDKTDCIYICNECGGTCPDNAALEATGKQAWEAELRGANLVEELADLIREWRFVECVSVMDIARTLIPILTRREEQAWQEGAKAALDAAAKVARGWTGGPPDMGTKAACLIETGIHTIDPASLRKDR